MKGGIPQIVWTASPGFCILVTALLVIKNLALSPVLPSSEEISRNEALETGGIDLGDILLVVFILVGFLLRGPLGYGFTIEGLARCPWVKMGLIWVIAFTSGRVLRLCLFRKSTRRLIRAGVINPAGSFQMLGRRPLGVVMLLGIPVVASGTLMEELLFRGIIPDLVARAGEFVLGSWASVAPQGCGVSLPAGDVNSLTKVVIDIPVMVGAVLFGFVHFLPAWVIARRQERIPALLLGYTFLMPAMLGLAFSYLNALSGSLWPGWILHWAHNYGSLVWNRIDGLWNRGSAID